MRCIGQVYSIFLNCSRWNFAGDWTKIVFHAALFNGLWVLSFSEISHKSTLLDRT